MPKSPSVVTHQEVVDFIRMKAPELIGDATTETGFDEMDVDSLALVEIAVMISEKYGIAVQDWEVAEAGSFSVLADLINVRAQSVVAT